MNQQTAKILKISTCHKNIVLEKRRYACFIFNKRGVVIYMYMYGAVIYMYMYGRRHIDAF